MSLGQQLAPHLPFLRRFGRALAGSQTAGDVLVRATLDAIVDDPSSFHREVYPRLALYRMFLDRWHLDGDKSLPSDQGKDADQPGSLRLLHLSATAREALLLTALEGFSSEDAGWLLDISAADIDALVSVAMREIEKEARARILIIEDDPIIAMDIATIVGDLGHEVIGTAMTRVEAVALALSQRPGLVLADIELADNSSGIDAVNDIFAHFRVPVIFITGHSERLLESVRPEPSFLITKPFARSTVKTAIAQALFFDQPTVAETALGKPAPFPAGLEQIGPTEMSSFSSASSGDLRQLEFADLKPLPAPLDAVVIDGRLRQVRAIALETQLGPDRIATLWRLHADTAERIADELEGSNAGRAFAARFSAVRHVLNSVPNDSDALAIGVHTHGLSRMLPIVREAMLDDVAADIEAFLSDLRDLAEHFGSYRDFVGEADRTPALPPEGTAALMATAKLLEDAPDEAVDPGLKESISEIRRNADASPDPIARLALLRAIGNVVKALARYLRDAGKGAGDKFAEEIGGELGKFAAKLIKGGTLLALAHFAPAGLSWVLTLVAVGQLVERGKANKDD